MKTFITLAVLVLAGLLSTPTISQAVEVTLPGGGTVDITGLSSSERSNFVDYMAKIQRAQASDSEIATTVAEKIVDNMPTTAADLQAWSTTITDTLKTMCTDLGVGVNEFVKTPVGIGVSGLVIYKLAGKELLSDALDIVLMLPIWLFFTSVILFTSWYMLSHKTVYKTIENVENMGEGKNKKTTKIPETRRRYDWNSRDARCFFGVFMLILEVALSIVALSIIFA
jgi:hypothetical protein